MKIIPALFEEHEIRRLYDEKTETWFFSVVDVIKVLTQQTEFQKARKYWNKLKERLSREGNQSVTNCHRLKLPAADGKSYPTDVANAETLLRLVQSVPSPKAEPIKLWLAKVGYETPGQSLGFRIESHRHQLPGKRVPQAGQFCLHDVPNELIVHAVIAVNQPIAQTHDSRNLWQEIRQGRFFPGGTPQSFADNLKLTLHRGSDQCVGRKPGGIRAGHKVSDRHTGGRRFQQALGDLRCHRR